MRDLQDAMLDRRVLAIVGAGMSAYTSGGNRLAVWSGFLAEGVTRCLEANPGLRDDPWHAAVREALAREDYLTAGDLVVQALGGQRSGRFASWLRATAKALEPVEPAGLRVLLSLDIPIATTNYDGLIERVTGLDHLTWSASPDRLRDWACSGGHVLHMHGYWDAPESIVMTNESYARIERARGQREVLRSLATRHSFLLLGFGAGLADPHFTSIRRWLRRHYGSSYSHFRLVPEGAREDAARFHHEEGDHIQVVGYSGSLADGLRALSADNLGSVIDSRITIRPATDSDIEKIWALDAAVFTEEDLIPASTFRTWQTHLAGFGGSAFWVADSASESGSLEAYYGLLFIAPHRLEQFKAGEIAEDQFAASDLCTPEQALEQREALIFSAVSAAPKGSSARRQLVRNLSERLRFYASEGQLEVAYTCAATVDGARLLNHLAAEGMATLWSSADGRADRHPIYRFEFTDESFQRWNELLPRIR
jgi:hypothetical protein